MYSVKSMDMIKPEPENNPIKQELQQPCDNIKKYVVEVFCQKNYGKHVALQSTFLGQNLLIEFELNHDTPSSSSVGLYKPSLNSPTGWIFDRVICDKNHIPNCPLRDVELNPLIQNITVGRDTYTLLFISKMKNDEAYEDWSKLIFLLHT